jgi:phage terminase large subunit GpA-like protein
VSLAPSVLSTFADAARLFTPPPRISLSEWAERECVLSSEDSAEPGRYRVARAPYQRGMQDAILDPLVEEVVFFTSAQVGKTQVEKNLLAYFMAEDPCAILFVLPGLDAVKRFSEQRLAPMVRDTPCLRALVSDKSNKVGAGSSRKLFPGGVLFLVTANSPTALASMPARVVFTDEEDRFEASSGDEGNPVQLAAKRQTTFWNRKRIRSSTTTIKGLSSIEAAYEASNKQKFFVPCPHCSAFQVLQWKRLIYPKDEPAAIDNVHYACEECGAAIAEFEKSRMLARGEWRAERPEISTVAGFWINELYSPFVKWHEMAAAWRKALDSHKSSELQTFVNLSLAESWEEAGEVLDGNELMRRREDYPPPALPDGVTVVTAGIDAQADRLEVEVVGWGKGEESWSIKRLRFEGDTAVLNGRKSNDGTYIPTAWEKLEEFLTKTQFLHARGVRLEIAAALVDSGYRASEVYAFTKTMQEKGLRVYACKGISGFGKAPLQKFNRNNRQRARLYPVGVDVIKKTVHDRLKIATAGGGYMHFSKSENDADYFAELTAEQLKHKYAHGFPVRFWEKKPGARNESLDCRVYAYAAFLSLSEKPEKMLERLREELLTRARQAAELRRAKLDPNQLPLITQDLEGSESSADDQRPTTNDSSPVQTPAEVLAPDVSLGEHEYVVAEKLDEQTAAEPASGPQVVVRRGKWL